MYARCDCLKEEVTNEVKALYKEFTPEQISAEIAQIVKPVDLDLEIEVI